MKGILVFSWLYLNQKLLRVLRFDRLSLLWSQRRCTLSLCSCCFQFKYRPLYFVLAIMCNLGFSTLDCQFLSKFIYCCLCGFLENVFYGFLDCVLFHLLSSILVLQVLRARVGLIRPTAVPGPFCLKSDEEDSRRKLIQGIQMQQQNPR